MTDFDKTKSCQGCPDRELACAATCECYAIRKAKREAERQARNRDKPVKDFRSDSYRRATRRK